MQRSRQVSLQNYNTFGLGARANDLVILDSFSDVEKVFKEMPHGLIIGGGSNILLKNLVYDAVIINRLEGIEIVDSREDYVTLAVGSGVIWHDLVLWTLSRNFGGLQNLSLIPGTVGAAPIQNIGAYGVEVRDVLTGVDYYHIGKQEIQFIPAEDCHFGYRESIFKKEWRNQGFIVQVYFRLTVGNHSINTEYAALQQYVAQKGWLNPSIHQISDAVVDIRKSKLPDWHQLGNAGSFFKNPVIGRSHFDDLQVGHPGIPVYPIDASRVKIPAAWLIQQAGFKGKRIGRVGCYEKQPLVLVNYGGATGAELLDLRDAIQEAVWTQFGVELVPEVTVL